MPPSGEVLKRLCVRISASLAGARISAAGGRMKILKKEVRGDTLYLTVEESQ